MFAQQAPHFHACHEATSDSVKQHKLRKLIAQLSSKEGIGSELISIYIPYGATTDEVLANIKTKCDSTDTKFESQNNRVQESLKNIIQRIKQQKEIPKNGLTIFAGNFVSKLEKENFLFEEIVPPKPIISFSLNIDNQFHLEPLREMLRNQKIVGLISLDAKKASFGIVNNERFEMLGSITSGIPGKSGKGGQSQRRYERERDMELNSYFHRIAEHSTKAFLENPKVTVLLVGGPGQTKTDFLRGDYLHYELKNALLDIVDTESAETQGVKEILTKSADALNNICTAEEKKTVQLLLAEMGKHDDLTTYGLNPVIAALKKGAVEVAITTDSTGIIEKIATCRKCGLSKTELLDKKNVQAIQEMISRPCENCKAVDYQASERDIVNVLEDIAVQTGARIEVISTASEEKAKLTALGGFAAILRYKLSVGQR